jgi:probable F420-dependent oxidoreductase
VIDVGVTLALQQWTGTDIRDIPRAVEQLGYSTLWLGDHVVLPDGIASEYPYGFRFPGRTGDHLFPSKQFPGALTTAGYMCAVTKTLRIGFGVLLASMRNAVVTAKELGSLHALSGERLVVGVGSGWLREEFDAIGASFAQRGAILDESIDVMRRLWTGPQPVSFSGEHYSFGPVHCEPQPVRPPEIWIGGHTPAALRRCAARGDGWYALDLPADELATASRSLDAACERIGRDPGTIRRGVAVRFALTGGGVDHVAGRIEAYLQSGCEHLVVFSSPGRTGTENIRRLERFRSLVDAAGLSRDLGFEPR